VNKTKRTRFYAKITTLLMKEIKETLGKWRGIPCPWIGMLNMGGTQFIQNFRNF
jgi:hypothetical protein